MNNKHKSKTIQLAYKRKKKHLYLNFEHSTNSRGMTLQSRGLVNYYYCSKLPIMTGILTDALSNMYVLSAL